MTSRRPIYSDTDYMSKLGESNYRMLMMFDPFIIAMKGHTKPEESPFFYDFAGIYFNSRLSVIPNKILKYTKDRQLVCITEEERRKLEGFCNIFGWNIESDIRGRSNIETITNILRYYCDFSKDNIPLEKGTEYDVKEGDEELKKIGNHVYDFIRSIKLGWGYEDISVQCYGSGTEKPDTANDIDTRAIVPYISNMLFYNLLKVDSNLQRRNYKEDERIDKINKDIDIHFVPWDMLPLYSTFRTIPEIESTRNISGKKLNMISSDREKNNALMNYVYIIKKTAKRANDGWIDTARNHNTTRQFNEIKRSTLKRYKLVYDMLSPFFDIPPVPEDIKYEGLRENKDIIKNMNLVLDYYEKISSELLNFIHN